MPQEVIKREAVEEPVVENPQEVMDIFEREIVAQESILYGVALFFEALLRKPATPERPVERYAKAVLSYRIPLGILGVAAALLHFLFPSAVIL